MIDFDAAIAKLQEVEGLDRGQAVARLKDAYDNNDPQISHIKDLESNLRTERVKSVGELGGAGVLRGIINIPEKIARAIQPSQAAVKGHLPLVGDEVLRKVESQVEPTPYVEGTGELAGGLVGYGLPWYGLEETIGGAATKFGLPWLASKYILPQALRGAGAGYILGKATGEDAETMAKIGAVAPFVGYAIARLGGAGLRKLGSIFTRPGAEEPVEAEFSKVKPEAEPQEAQKALPEPTTAGPVTAPAPEPSAPEGPIPKPATSIS